MNSLEFISELVKALAWPVAILIIVMLLREEIAKLMPSLRKFKAGPLEAEFEQEVKAITESVNVTGKSENTQALTTVSHSFLTQLAELNPRSAILESWIRVEAAARSALESKSTSVTSPNYVPASRLAAPLAQERILGPTDIALFHELRRLRNEVAHAQGFEPTQKSAHQYIDLASTLLATIESMSVNA